MPKIMSARFVFCFVAMACLVALAGVHVTAQDVKPLNETYQAQALGQGTQLGRTFNVTLIIQRYSTTDERQILIDSFNKAGSQGLYNALEKMPAMGRIAITGTLGYDINFARKVQTATGYTIRVLGNRPIGFTEAWVDGRSMDYNLSYLELNVNDNQKDSTGTLLPAVQFVIDKKTNELTANNFQNPWKLFNIMNRSKK